MKRLAGSQGCWGFGGGEGQATSVPKPRALSPSPEILLGAPLTSKILDTDTSCLWRGPFISGISLLPSVIYTLWGVVQAILLPRPRFPCLCCIHDCFHYTCFM